MSPRPAAGPLIRAAAGRTRTLAMRAKPSPGGSGLHAADPAFSPPRPLTGAKPVDAFHERLIERAATIDELLSEAFEPVPSGHGDAELAKRRIAAWCRSAA